MLQPRNWWWGLAPLALIWSFAALQKAGPIAADLSAKATSAGAAVAGLTPGLAPISASVSGRDVRLSGDLRASAMQPLALKAADEEFGVRRVESALRAAQAQRPYVWSAERQGSRIILSGSVPDGTSKANNASAAARAFAGAEIDDRQRIAFGAPAGFTAAAAAGLAELGFLSSGKATLTDAAFCFEGVARTPDAFLELRPRIANPPPGFTAQPCSVAPPTAEPYLWSALKAPGGALALAGFYPSDAVRAEINAAVAAAAPGVAVVDTMKPSLGAPSAFVQMISAGMAQLARMAEGTASISGTSFSVTGRGPAGFEACDALRRGLAGQLAPGFTLGSAEIACPAPPPPPPPPAPAIVIAPPAPPPPPPIVLAWSAVKDASGVTLSGLAPNSVAKAAAASSAFIATTGAVVDRLNVQGPIATPPDYGPAVNFALGLMARLASGDVALEGASLSVSGIAPSAAAKSEIDASLAAALPGGLRLARADIAVALPPPPPHPVAPPAIAVAPPAPPAPPPPLAPPPPVAAPQPPPPPPPVALAWSASKDGEGVALSGLSPSAEARSAVAAAARAATDRTVTDASTVQANVASPPDFAPAAAFALRQLGRLSIGRAELAGPSINLSGVAPSLAEKRAVVAEMAGALPGGMTLGAVAILVRPYRFEAQADRSGVVLSGYVPDEATRAALVAAAAAGGFAGKVRDELEFVEDAPTGFAAAANVALAQLVKLDFGTARLENQRLSVQGMTCRNDVKLAVEAASGAGLPTGFAGSGAVSIRQTGCFDCQFELDRATKGRAIQFEQARAEISPEARTLDLLESIATVLQACPNARIAVEGHTNADGTPERNMKLSQARAQAVVDALVARGLGPDRLRAVGLGQSQPLVPHGSDHAREVNRRVRFVVVP
jgi:outer membrane protein OmpA-like peptidoglycan-associated protein